MLKFTLCGTLGCTHYTDGELTLVLASPTDTQSGTRRVAWILCVVRDRDLRTALSPDLQLGELLRIQGFIEQQQRKVGGQSFCSVAFVATTIERLP
ncbi:MAG: hypothetical protein QM759_12430 [Terricaulis sp.]